MVDGEPNAASRGLAEAECFPEALRFAVADGQGTPAGRFEPRPRPSAR